LEHVDGKHPGSGLYKKLGKCGVVTKWHFSRDADQVLKCEEGYFPYGPKTDEQARRDKKEKKKCHEKYKKCTHCGGWSKWVQGLRVRTASKKKKKCKDACSFCKDCRVPVANTLTDLGTDINAAEPLPPEQDDIFMS